MTTHGRRLIVHHAVCQHRVEVVVSPARAQLVFQDEADADPINTRIRFEATVLNSDRGVTWQVVSPMGGPGAGTIDATGLYRTPPFAAHASGVTDIVVATSRADPLRRAYAWLTVVGRGPASAPRARVEIWPRRATIYHKTGNARYVDACNKRQVFRAYVTHAANPDVKWIVGGVPRAGGPPDSSWFIFEGDGAEALQDVVIRAELGADPSVSDHALVTVRDYNWPPPP